MSLSVGFIGAGRVARILLGGWEKAGALPARVVACDVNPVAFEALRSVCPRLETTSDPGPACRQDLVFLAVHPPVVKEVLPAIKPHLTKTSILVSLAPKVTLARLSEMTGGEIRIVRMIPNAPCLVGRGFNPVVYGTGLSSAEKQRLAELFAAWGDCPEVPEEHLEVYAILAAMGPTYFWPQIDALAQLGEIFGLSREAALRALDKMLWGALAMLRQSGLSSQEIMDLVPVKPMAQEVETLADAYRARLTGLMEKLRP